MRSVITTAIASLAVGQVLAFPHVRRAEDGLNIRAKAAGKAYFGSATDNGELSDAPYLAQLSNTSDFGQITPGNSQKWDATEPSRGTFTYAQGDVIADLAEKNGQLLRCHTLVWHNQLPQWVTNGNFDNATLVSILKNHITNVVNHYKGRCYAWDVVNEGLEENGTYRNSIFYKTIGEAYLPIAFAAAAAADPTTKLYYNDYNLEYNGDKTTGAQRIVKLIQSYGVKIDGVGLQGHLIVGSTPGVSAQTAVLNGFAALGVETAYTELDIRMPTPPTPALLDKQASDYANTVTACKNVASCVGVTIWDWTDKYSWIPSVFAGQGAALPWDETFVKKPAYAGILNALGPAPAGPTSTSSSAVVTPTSTSVSSSTSVVTRTTTTSASSTSAKVTSTPATTTTSAPSPTATAVAKHWEQCGGIGWKGPTTCAAPYTCKFGNDWYSQCL